MTWGGFGGSKPAKTAPTTTEKHSLFGDIGSSIKHALHMDDRQQQPTKAKAADKPAPIAVSTTSREVNKSLPIVSEKSQPTVTQLPEPTKATPAMPISTETATPSRPATAWSGFGSSSGRPTDAQKSATSIASDAVDMDRLAAKLERLVSIPPAEPAQQPAAATDDHTQVLPRQQSKVFVLDESDEDMAELLATVQPKTQIAATANPSAESSAAPSTEAVVNISSPKHAVSPPRAATPVRRVSVASGLPVTATNQVAPPQSNTAADASMPLAKPTSPVNARSPTAAQLRSATPVRRVSVADATLVTQPVAVVPTVIMPLPSNNVAPSSTVTIEQHAWLQQQHQDLQRAYTALDDRDTLRSTIIQGLNTQVQQLQAAVSEREQQLKTQQLTAAQQLAALQTKYNSLKDSLNEQLEGSSQLIAKLSERDARVAKYQAMMSELQSLHKNTIPVTEVQTVLQQKDQTLAELQRQLASMQQQHELLQQQHATSTQQLQLLQVQSDVANSDLQGQYEKLTQQFGSEKSALQTVVQTLRAESNKHRHRAEQLADTVTELQAENIRKQSDVTTREQTLIISNTKLTKHLQRSQSETEHLQQQVAVYNEQHKRLEQQLYERKVQVDTLSSLLKPAQAQTARHDAETDELLSATIKLPVTSKQSSLQTRMDQLANELASLQATG